MLFIHIKPLNIIQFPMVNLNINNHCIRLKNIIIKSNNNLDYKLD